MNDDFKNYIQLLIDNKDKITHLPERDIHNLLDYITNLQQENEKWWAIIKDYEMDLHDLWNKNNELEQENERLKDQNINEILKKDLEICTKQYKKSEEKLEKYKSRIEKAVEYIKINCITSDKWEDLGFCNFVPTGKITYKQLCKNKISKLLNILNGRSDE